MPSDSSTDFRNCAWCSQLQLRTWTQSSLVSMSFTAIYALHQEPHWQRQLADKRHGRDRGNSENTERHQRQVERVPASLAARFADSPDIAVMIRQSSSYQQEANRRHVGFLCLLRPWCSALASVDQVAEAADTIEDRALFLAPT